MFAYLKKYSKLFLLVFLCCMVAFSGSIILPTLISTNQLPLGFIIVLFFIMVLIFLGLAKEIYDFLTKPAQ